MRTPSMTFSPHSRGFVALLLVAACTSVQPETAITSTSTTAPVTTTTTASEESTTTTSVTTTTIPSPGSVLVIGDWGAATEAQAGVADAMEAYADSHEVAAILTTGDNLYSDQADLLMAPMDWALRRGIPVWVAWGNHDVETSSRIEVVNETFGSPPRWAAHRWGEVDVMILDSNQVFTPEQIEFLSTSLATSESPTVVVFHHPALSCGGSGDSGAVLETWVPRFDDDVVLVLNGHDHNYQRFSEGGVSYVVSGGGGASIYELRSCPAGHPERISGEAVHHFLVLTQDGEEIEVDVVDLNGDTIDAFSVPLG